jgi:4-amino-4-deoxy-L-arabinose transferase-like glycosyltransferase
MTIETPTAENRAALLVLSGLVLAVTFGDIGVQELHGTAAFYAALAREMLDNGNLLAPFQGPHAYLLKPPLALWLSALCSWVFGLNDFAMTLPSRLGGVGCVILTYLLGKRLYGVAGGWFAALVFATNGIYIQFTTNFRMDSLMTFGALLTVWGYLNLRSNRGAACLFGGITIAALTKGPMIFAMVLIFVPHALAASPGREIARGVRYWWLLLLLPAAWFGYLWLVHGTELAAQLNYDFWRGDTAVGLSALDSAILEYVIKPMNRLLPWLPFMLIAIAVATYESCNAKYSSERRADIALILGLFILNFVIAAIKPDPDVRYLYPSLPLLAVLTGGVFARLSAQRIPRWVVGLGLGVLLLCLGYIGIITQRGLIDNRGLEAMQSLAARGKINLENTAVITDVIPPLDAPRRNDPVRDSAYYYFGFAPTNIYWPSVKSDLSPQYRYFVVRRKRVYEAQLRELGLAVIARSAKLILLKRV